MTEISVLIPTIGEKTLELVLESVQAQTFKDYELVIVDSSENQCVSNLIGNYDARTIKTSKNVGLLQAKYLGSKNASGKFCLFLDATKTLKPAALMQLSKMKETYDMVLIFEDREGHGKWTNLAKLDKEILMNDLNLYRNGDVADYLVPRFYRKDLSDRALERLKSILDKDVFEKVLWPEDRLIFLEAKKFSKSIGVAKSPLITHIGNDTYFSVAQKYRRYGKSYRMLTRLFRIFEPTQTQITASLNWKLFFVGKSGFVPIVSYEDGLFPYWVLLLKKLI